MPDVLSLPKSTPSDQQDLLDALESMIRPATEERNEHYVEWEIAKQYIQGKRYFDIQDWGTGQVFSDYVDEDGKQMLRWDDVMTRRQTEIGRLASLDTRPRSTKRLHAIESLRAASLNQALLDAAFDDSENEAIKIQFFAGLCDYGTYGLMAVHDPNSVSPIRIRQRLIPPWQLLGLPARASNHHDRTAVCRTRIMPLAELEKVAKAKKLKLPDDEALLECVELSYGAEISEDIKVVNASGSSIWDRTAQSKQGQTYGDKTDGKNGMRKYVRVVEVWVLNGPNELARTIWKIGKWIALDNDFLSAGLQLPLPIGIGRFDDTGHFYGRSWLSKLIPVALHAERFLETTIEHAKDQERFTYLDIPMHMGYNLEDFKATTPVRILTHQHEAMTDNDRLNAVQSPASTDTPIKMWQMLVGVLDRITAQGPMYAGMSLGRVESGEAYSEIKNTGATHLVPIAVSIKGAFTGLYRHALSLIRTALQKGTDVPGGIEITRIDNSIAGLKIDATTGRMILDQTSLPDPWGSVLDIRSHDPNAADRERQEALLMLQMWVNTQGKTGLHPMEFIILNYKNGWNYPVGQKAVWDNYVKAVLYNIILFNDGEEPGTFPNDAEGRPVIARDVDRAEIQLMAIEDFVSGPEFMLASEEVKQAFYNRITQLKSMGGTGGMPDNATSLEMLGMQGAQGGQGMARLAG